MVIHMTPQTKLSQHTSDVDELQSKPAQHIGLKSDHAEIEVCSEKKLLHMHCVTLSCVALCGQGIYVNACDRDT